MKILYYIKKILLNCMTLKIFQHPAFKKKKFCKYIRIFFVCLKLKKKVTHTHDDDDDA